MTTQQFVIANPDLVTEILDAARKDIGAAQVIIESTHRQPIPIRVGLNTKHKVRLDILLADHWVVLFGYDFSQPEMEQEWRDAPDNYLARQREDENAPKIFAGDRSETMGWHMVDYGEDRMASEELDLSGSEFTIQELVQMCAVQRTEQAQSSPPAQFPELREPTIMDPDSRENLVQSHQDAVDNELRQSGGEELRTLYVLAHNDLTVRRKLGLAHQVESAFFPEGFVMMRSRIAELEAKAGDLLQVIMLIADTMSFLAEVAELAIFRSREGQGHTPRLSVQSDIDASVGISSFGEVIKGWESVNESYAQCLVAIQKSMESDVSINLQRRLLIDLEELVVKCLRSITQAFLFLHALMLEKNDPTILFSRADLFEVGPYLVKYPGARHYIRSSKTLYFALAMVQYLLDKTISSTQIAFSLFQGMGHLAVVVGEYAYARKCYELAARYAEGNQVEGLQKANALLDSLDPQPNAQEEK